jgi:RNA polymerase sigma factor (sigma-70 family)
MFLIGWIDRRRDSKAMSSQTDSDVRKLIERLREGDLSARRALLERILDRLRRIAASSLQRFPRLRSLHDVDSVVDDAWMQLMKALETTRPETPEGFYRLVFRKVRHVLLDLARRQGREDSLRREVPPNGSSTDSRGQVEIADTTMEPSHLAFWTEIHREVGRLPEQQRAVFRFHYFAEIPQSDIARLLDLHPRQVSRLWVAATMRLAQRLGGLEELDS